MCDRLLETLDKTIGDVEIEQIPRVDVILLYSQWLLLGLFEVKLVRLYYLFLSIRLWVEVRGRDVHLNVFKAIVQVWSHLGWT